MPAIELRNPRQARAGAPLQFSGRWQLTAGERASMSYIGIGVSTVGFTPLSGSDFVHAVSAYDFRQFQEHQDHYRGAGSDLLQRTLILANHSFPMDSNFVATRRIWLYVMDDAFGWVVPLSAPYTLI